MDLIHVVFTLIVIGVLLWLVNTFMPMARSIKSILNLVVVIAVVLWLLNGFGFLHSLSRIHMRTLRSCLTAGDAELSRVITHENVTAEKKPRMARKDFQIAQPGERTNGAGKPVSNKLLLSIPDSEYHAIRPHLEFLSLPPHRTLYEPNRPLEFVYFPNSGMVSLVIETEDGRTVEVGEVGKEGFAGIPAAVGMKKSQVREIVQIEGNGFRMRVGVLPSLLNSIPQFQLMLTRYAVVQGLQIAQTAACNRLHNIEQRLARWLLITQDRVDSPKFAITQDFLATMLGTDRPTVTVTSGILQKKKIIVHTRGVVQILSRAKLQSCACECYEAIQLDRFGEGPLRQGMTFETRTRRMES